jgi:hypothetical protein
MNVGTAISYVNETAELQDKLVGAEWGQIDRRIM